MCTGNRRGEFNDYGFTAGLPWANGSISTARWKGALLADVLGLFMKESGKDFEALEADGYRYVTFWGDEDYHVSIPLHKACSRAGECLLAYSMNGAPIPRDHGFP